MKTKQQRLVTILAVAVALILLGISGWLVYDNTIDRSGWQEKDGIRFYRDFHADPVTGWWDIAGEVYCFAEGGIPLTGWQKLEEQTFWFDEMGVMATGLREIGGSTYYFEEGGPLHTGWLDREGERYYFGSDGAMVTGWNDVDGLRRFFGANGVLVTGWLVRQEGTYYFDENGQYLTGRTAIDDKAYYFLEDGTMFTGWDGEGESRRYYGEDGAMVSGWVQIDGKQYLLEEDGTPYLGWYNQGEYRYYFTEDGSAAVGPRNIDGKLYHFTPKGIQVVLVNIDHAVPKDYDPDLVTVVDWHEVSQVALEPLKKMLADCNAAGIEYTFNSAYRTIEEQTAILEYRTNEHMENYDLDFEEAREKALETVAIPGTSEHHLGLAVDLLGDEAVAWFTEHCWEYGFIVRYLDGKSHITGITHEPWHYRYVGREVSMDMKDSGLCLEEYLGAVVVDEHE